MPVDIDTDKPETATPTDRGGRAHDPEVIADVREQLETGSLRFTGENPANSENDPRAPAQPMATRTAQDLLAERRANALELHRETDDTAKAMLQFHIDGLDRELASATFEACGTCGNADRRAGETCLECGFE